MPWQQIKWNPLESLEARKAKEEADKHYKEMWEKAPEQLAKWKDELKNTLYNSWKNLDVAKDFASTVKWLKEHPENIKKALDETKWTFEYSNLWIDVISKNNWYIDELAEAFLDSKKNKLWNKTETKQELHSDWPEAIFWWDKPDPYWRENAEQKPAEIENKTPKNKNPEKNEEQAWKLVDSNWKWVTNSAWEQVKSWELNKKDAAYQEKESEIQWVKEKMVEDSWMEKKDFDEKLSNNHKEDWEKSKGFIQMKGILFNETTISYYLNSAQSTESKEIWNSLLWKWEDPEQKENNELLLQKVWQNFVVPFDTLDMNRLSPEDWKKSIKAMNNAFDLTARELTIWKTLSWIWNDNLRKDADNLEKQISESENPLEKLNWLKQLEQIVNKAQAIPGSADAKIIKTWQQEKAWIEQEKLNKHTEEIQKLINENKIPEDEKNKLWNTLQQTIVKWLRSWLQIEEVNEILGRRKAEITKEKPSDKVNEIIREINQAIWENNLKK